MILNNKMDLEKVFFRFHGKLIHSVTNNFLSDNALRFWDKVAIINAILALFTLIYLHMIFVSPMFQPSCVVSALKDQLGNLSATPDVLEVNIKGIWSKLADMDSSAAQALQKIKYSDRKNQIAPELIDTWLNDPTFLYSKQQGYLMIPRILREQHGITQVNMTLDLSCVPKSSVVIFLLENFIGYHTVVRNTLIYTMGGEGFMYDKHAHNLVDLSYASSSLSESGLPETPLLYTIMVTLGVFVTTIFLFFITTTIVQHTLRETQEMMLTFTYTLQKHIKAKQSYHNLVINHALNSFVFVPIMVGTLFFLFEFFNDQLLAFMVLALVWIGELFSVITLRTATTIRVFPKLFFVYFAGFHIYFFTFPSGFSYLALTTTVVFLHHAMLLLWNRYEIPNFRDGTVSEACPRQLVVGSTQDTCAYGLPPSLAFHAFLAHLVEPKSLDELEEENDDDESGNHDADDELDSVNDNLVEHVQRPIARRSRNKTDGKSQSPPRTGRVSNIARSVSPHHASSTRVVTTKEPVRRKKRKTIHSSPTLALSSDEQEESVLAPRKFFPGGNM